MAIIKGKNWVQIAGLFLFLVFLPLGSWYYLQTGLDYRLQARSELQDIAPLPEFHLKNYNDTLVHSNRFADLLVVGYFYSPVHKAAYGDVLSRLKQQFDGRQDVCFVAFSEEPQRSAQSFLQEFEVSDTSQVFFLEGRGEELVQLAEAAALPETNGGLGRNSHLFFADSSMIRGYYDLLRPDDLKLLVKHITLNLHPLEEPDIIFQRETEK